MFRRSMKHAIDGIIHTIKSERNFRIHMVILIITIIAGLFFRITLIEWLAIILISTMVLFAELINTAFEKTLDWLEPNHDEVVKIVKDVSAGAVLVCAVGAVLIGILIFTPHMVELFYQLFDPRII